MPSITQQLDARFRAAIRAAFDLDADPLVGPSANPQFGDYQSNAAMGLAKRVAEATGAKANPRQVAEQVKARLDLGEIASEVSIAGPGFINVRLDPKWLAGQLNVALADERLGVPVAASPQTVVVDYGGPNVAKEMHVGHLRSTIIGDCFARVLAFLGHDVVRQNHLGDWGTQFGMLIHLLSTAEAGSDAAAIDALEDFYRQAKQRFDADPTFAAAARDAVVKLQAGDAATLASWRKIVDATRRAVMPVFERLGVQLADASIQKEPIERGESFYNPLLPAVVDDLTAKSIATLSDGAIVVFVDGFDAPLMVRKTDGGFGYGTTDLAAVRHRVGTLGARRLIYVVGSPQSQHLAQVFATSKRAGFAPEDVTLEHAAFGSVLGEDGKLFRTRTGGTIKLADLLDEAERRALALVTEKDAAADADRKLPPGSLPAIARAVGIGAVKYFDLLRDRNGDYKFSFDAMLAMDGNTAPYLQYAHARIRSIFRKAGERASARGSSMVEALTEPEELTLAKVLLRFGESVEMVARDLKPHVLCTYLYDLAGAFSSFYDACPVLKSEDATRTSRLALCELTAQTLARGLDLLGIEHPEQM